MATSNARYHQELQQNTLTKHAALENAEKYVSALYTVICEAYGLPMFGVDLHPPALYEGISKRAYAVYKTLMSASELVFADPAKYETHKKNIERDVDAEFASGKRHNVFSDAWIDKVHALCAALINKFNGGSLSDAQFACSKISVHCNIMLDKGAFGAPSDVSPPSKAPEKPQLWQYHRLLAVVMALSVVERSIIQLHIKK
jgi:hypothetical protein